MGKSTSYIKLGAVIFVVIVASGITLNALGVFGKPVNLSINDNNNNDNNDNNDGDTTNANCPDTGYTTSNVTVKNLQDTTSDSSLTPTLYFYATDGSDFQTGAAGTTISLYCGKTYDVKAVSTDGPSGKNAFFSTVERGKGTVSNGVLTFTPTGPIFTIRVGGSMHGTLNAKVLDMDTNSFAYAKEGSPTQGAYKTTGTTFVKDSANSTFSMSTTDTEQQFKMYFRTNQSNSRYDDYGYWILITANTSVYQEPVVRVNGITLANDKGAFDSFENRLYGTTYHYAYKVTGSKVANSDNELFLDFRALDGIEVGGGDDVTVAFQSIGAVKQTANDQIRYAMCSDAASPSAIYTIQSYTLDMS